MTVRKPGIFMRGMVLAAQGVFFNTFFLAYLLSPRTCHRFVGYLEEEAVKTYTRCLEDIDSGKLEKWRTMEAPQIAKDYWRLGDDASFRDVIAAVRADEACHRHVNHKFADLGPDDQNPFVKGSTAHQ